MCLKSLGGQTQGFSTIACGTRERYQKRSRKADQERKQCSRYSMLRAGNRHCEQVRPIVVALFVSIPNLNVVETSQHLPKRPSWTELCQNKSPFVQILVKRGL